MWPIFIGRKTASDKRQEVDVPISSKIYFFAVEYDRPVRFDNNFHL